MSTFDQVLSWLIINQWLTGTYITNIITPSEWNIKGIYRVLAFLSLNTQLTEFILFTGLRISAGSVMKLQISAEAQKNTEHQ